MFLEIIGAIVIAFLILLAFAMFGDVIILILIIWFLAYCVLKFMMWVAS